MKKKNVQIDIIMRVEESLCEHSLGVDASHLKLKIIFQIKIVLQFDEYITWIFTEADWRCINCRRFQFHILIID